MSSRPQRTMFPFRVWAGLVGFVLVVLSMPMWLPRAPAGPSVESRLAEGALGFRRVLEAWGASVELEQVGDRAAAGAALEAFREGSAGQGPASQGRGAVFVAFPAQRTLLPSAPELKAWLDQGGKLAVGYSGALVAIEEGVFLDEIGAGVRPDPEPSSLLPWRWWRAKRGGERHHLVDHAEIAGDVAQLHSDVLTARASVSDCRPVVERSSEFGRARRSNRGSANKERSDGTATVVRCERGTGVLWLLPSSLLSNARIHRSGNLELAHRMYQDLGDRWLVLEGSLAAPAATPTEQATNARRTLNTMAVQLGLLYLGALVALAWSFGPRWTAAAPAVSGHREFLLGVGSLHQRLGGYEQAARTLRQRWLDYDPLSRGREQPPIPDETAGDDLLALARRCSRTTARVRPDSGSSTVSPSTGD